MADKKFVNGAFIKRIWTDSNDPKNELLSVGLKKREFIQNLERIAEDAEGFINLRIGSQKGNRDKFSLFEDDRPQTTQPNTTNTTAPQTTPPVSEDDDLPF